ncbi:MAG: UDP-N-acetylmuramoyl-tripeptide--D-alanyl-D-alanine ligase [Ignavibacteriaceae bacterium]|nr:UDP-N-acetylmuramoyl-tripeptide--D-alanyl-D-alanine ligase [Ignavibacteriaceae bacterium]
MKKIRLNIEDLFELPTAVIYSPDKFKAISKVTIDSLNVKKNSLFIAIKGNRFDGHDFVKDAVKNGASVVLVNEKKLNEYDDVKVPIITVKNTIKALGDIAKIWRKKLSAKVVAITGSSGKTTVKDMLAELLSEKYSVSKTKENNNNHIGVPLTILNTNGMHEVLVAELGTNHFEEISYTSKIISPDYALITNIGTSHIQFLKNKNGVWKEKSALFDAAIENNGKVFINHDDPIIKKYKVKRNQSIKYSMKAQTNVCGKIKKYTDDGRPLVELISNRKKISAELPVYGEQNARSFIAAAAVALELGISTNKLMIGLQKIKMPAGRMNVIKLKNSYLIDDTYNANPDSTEAAIELVNQIKIYKRKFLFLGDMLELGKHEKILHENLVDPIMKLSNVDIYTIGKRMKHLNKKLIEKKIIAKHFSSRESLLNQIKKMDFNNSVILVKGSRRMRMEKFLIAIKQRAC